MPRLINYVPGAKPLAAYKMTHLCLPYGKEHETIARLHVSKYPEDQLRASYYDNVVKLINARDAYDRSKKAGIKNLKDRKEEIDMLLTLCHTQEISMEEEGIIF